MTTRTSSSSKRDSRIVLAIRPRSLRDLEPGKEELPMKKNATRKPYFARFLEKQELTEVQGGGIFMTLKYPSDGDEEVTLKYPSDDDEYPTS
jgi:hypothetical protein